MLTFSSYAIIIIFINLLCKNRIFHSLELYISTGTNNLGKSFLYRKPTLFYCPEFRYVSTLVLLPLFCSFHSSTFFSIIEANLLHIFMNLPTKQKTVYYKNYKHLKWAFFVKYVNHRRKGGKVTLCTSCASRTSHFLWIAVHVKYLILTLEPWSKKIILDFRLNVKIRHFRCTYDRKYLTILIF